MQNVVIAAAEGTVAVVAAIGAVVVVAVEVMNGSNHDNSGCGGRSETFLSSLFLWWRSKCSNGGGGVDMVVF